MISVFKFHFQESTVCYNFSLRIISVKTYLTKMKYSQLLHELWCTSDPGKLLTTDIKWHRLEQRLLHLKQITPKTIQEELSHYFFMYYIVNGIFEK